MVLKFLNLEKKLENFSDQMEIPKELTLGDSVITSIGNREFWIENFRGVLECDENRILILGKKGKINILGKKLVIHQYSKEIMEIVGIIKSIEYL